MVVGRHKQIVADKRHGTPGARFNGSQSQRKKKLIARSFRHARRIDAPTTGAHSAEAWSVVVVIIDHKAVKRTVRDMHL